MADPPRIAFINTDSLSMNVLMRGQLEYLKSRGARLDLYAGGPREQQDVLRARNIGRVTNVPFRRPPHPLWDAVCLIWLTALLAVRRYDAVVYSTPKAMFLGSIACWLTRQRRRVAWVRGRAYENMSGAKRRLYLAFDRITFACSHDVLFVSHSLEQAYRSDGVTKGRVVGSGSSNGVDTDRFRPASTEDRAEARAALDLSDEHFLVLIVGRLKHDKGTAEALQVIKSLADQPNLRFQFVGLVEDPALGREVAESPDPRIGLAPQTGEIERYFAAADLHLMTTHREGLPNVALEAAAMGVPTVAFDVVGVRDVVIPSVTGETVPFGDVAALAAQIRTAAADRSAFRNRYSGASAYIVERFAQPDVWGRYAEIFSAGRLLSSD